MSRRRRILGAVLGTQPEFFIELEVLVRRRGTAQGERDLLGDLEAVAFERGEFARMIGEHANPAQSQINQNLRTDAAFTPHLTLPIQILFNLTARMEKNARQSFVFAGL